MSRSSISIIVIVKIRFVAQSASDPLWDFWIESRGYLPRNTTITAQNIHENEQYFKSRRHAQKGSFSLKSWMNAISCAATLYTISDICFLYIMLIGNENSCRETARAIYRRYWSERWRIRSSSHRTSRGTKRCATAISTFWCRYIWSYCWESTRS